MGYPKYDKEEAKRVYEESVNNYNKKNPPDQGLTVVLTFLITTAAVGVVVLLVNLFSETNNTPVKRVSKEVVVTKYGMRSRKSKTFVVSYYLLDSKESGTFETDEIYFSVGDTININIEIPN